MGVKNLNNIVKLLPISEDKMPCIDTIIMDGFNVAFTYMQIAASNLKSSAPRTKYDTFNCNMITQMKFIVETATEKTINLMEAWLNRFHPKCIYFVMDPPGTVQYRISNDMDMNDYIRKCLLNGADDNIIDLKLDEQQARQKSSEKSRLSMINKLHDIDSKYGKDIMDVYRQSAQYLDDSNIHSLKYAIIYTVCRRFNELHPNILKFVESQDEADLIIKNIGEMESLNGNVLICSRDTDYSVLFSNNPAVYVTDITIHSKVYSPLTQWRNAFTIIINDEKEVQLIGDNDIYDYVIRLAPLFGNDYNRDTIISADVIVNCLKVFYPSLFHQTSSMKSNIDKLIIREKDRYGDKLVKPEQFDEIIVDYFKSYLNKSPEKYMFSLCVYKNYKEFSHYRIVDELPSYDKIIKRVFDIWRIHDDPDGKYTKNDMINAGKHEKFYDWDTSKNDLSDVEELPDDDALLYDIYRKTDINKAICHNNYKSPKINNIPSDEIISLNNTISSDIIDQLLDDV